MPNLSQNPLHFRREQVQGIYHEGALLSPISLLSVLIVAILFRENVSSECLILWVISSVLLSFFSILISWRFRRIAKKPFSPEKWERLFLAGQLGMGLYWGYASLILLPGTTTITSLLAVAIIGGILVYASTVLTINFTGFLFFAIPPLTGIMIQGIFSANETSRFIYSVYFLFGIFILYSAYAHAARRKKILINHRKLIEQARISPQTQLEAKVLESTLELTQANELLDQQIALRKKVSAALIKSQTRLSQAIDASQLELWDWDLVAGQRHPSSKPFHLFNNTDIAADEFLKASKERIHPKDYPATHQALLSYLNGNTSTYQAKYRLKTKQNIWCWVEDHGKAINHNEKGAITRILGTRRNIDAEYRSKEQLRLSKSVIDNTSEGIFILDTEFRFIAANPAWLHILNMKKDSLIGHSLLEVSHTPQKNEVYTRALNEAKKQGFWQAELFEKRFQGEYFPLWLRFNTITDSLGEISHFIGLANDLSDQKKADEKLDYLLNYDDLTGMANRSLLLTRMHQALNRVRDKNESFTLMLVNIDRFKYVNESVGHKNGDAILKEVGQRVKTTLPSADTVARLGNDEFAVLMNSTTRTLITEDADRLLSTLSKTYIVQDKELNLSCSIGIVRAPENSKDLQILLQQADMAVRQAKYLGGMNYQFYIDELQTFSQHRLSVESELRKALQDDEFKVYYQPKMNLASDLIDSAEALIRWHHPKRGLISPSEFINIAEESGIISEIGNLVLFQACHQAKSWHDAGLGKIKVSVNLSAHQLRQKTIFREVMKALQESGLDPHQLELELTESCLMENRLQVIEQLNKIGSLGVDISIDDFGTGYSSLSYLKYFPVDALKIDQSFIKDLCINSKDAAIVKTIIVLGKSLKLKVVAEGVENQEQCNLLKLLGCHSVQGYLISQPLDGESMTGLLQRNSAESLM